MLIGAAVVLGASAIDGFDFSDPELAERYRVLLAELRCPKCLNESLASSGAPIARDLRRAVRRLLEEGATDDDVRGHLRARYGDFVLYDPEFRATNWPLWVVPPVLLLIAIVVIGRVGLFRRRAPLTNREREQVAQLVGNKRLGGAAATGGDCSMDDERGRATGGAEGAGCGALLEDER